MELLNASQVANLLNVSVSYVWKLATKDPTFPKPVKFGDPDGPRRGRVTRWVKSQVLDWVVGKQGGREDECQSVSGDVHQVEAETVAT